MFSSSLLGCSELSTAKALKDNVIKRPNARKCLNLLRPLSAETGVNWDFVVFIVMVN
ncbi:hypothetical protein [uncultured Gammaproteobacteria bacterium]|nr:hypothetical protein [uncultured Gammaproteobacteria bacterium]CAC9592943.1 hypothetical protein [uncultured Gammaproteobacteria bacterium]